MMQDSEEVTLSGRAGSGRRESPEKNDLFLFQIPDDFLNVSLENRDEFHCNIPDIVKVYFGIVMN